MPVYAVVVAAGRGKRFGAAKQFFLFRGCPVLIHTLKHFSLNKNITGILVAVPKSRVDSTKKLIKKWGIEKVKAVVPGGKRRQDSVANCLKSIRGSSGIVAIHDGVRPLISQGLINKGIKLCSRYGAVVFGMPVHETIKKVKNNRVIKTVARTGLYLVQTPQFFKLAILKRTLKNVDFSYEYTDEAALLEECGIPVYLFKGEFGNIKITEKSDLKFLERYFK